MKFPKLFKKAAALVMAAVTTFSVLPATTAFAAGDIGTISFDFTYDRNGNAMRYNSSAVFDGYTAGGTGSYKYRMYVDGDDAFCIQPGVPLKTGNTLKKNSSQTWNVLSSSQKKAVGLALLYGYQGNRSHLSGSDDEKWLATQTLVWEFVTGCRESTGAYQQTSQKAYSLHFGSNYPNSGAAEVYNQIVSLLSKHNTIPSFMSGGADDITKELSYRAIQEQMEAIFQQYPKVLEAVDTETAAELSQQECAALIKVMELRNNLTDIEMQTVYFRGCYDSVGYLKKAGIL